MNSEILIPPGKNHQQKSWVFFYPNKNPGFFWTPKILGFSFFAVIFGLVDFGVMARCLVSMAMPQWRRVVVPYLYEVPGASVAQLIDAPGVLRPSQGEPQVGGDPGRMEWMKWMKWMKGEGISDFFFQTFVGLVGRIILQPFQFSAPWDIFFFGGPFFWCVLSLSVWSLFAGYPTADR